MALTIYENKEATVSKIKIDRRLYTDAAGSLVEDGDPEATMLFCSAGKTVSRADFEAAGGIIEETEAEPVAEVAPESEPKPKAKPKAKAAPKKKGK